MPIVPFPKRRKTDPDHLRDSPSPLLNPISPLTIPTATLKNKDRPLHLLDLSHDSLKHIIRYLAKPDRTIPNTFSHVSHHLIRLAATCKTLKNLVAPHLVSEKVQLEIIPYATQYKYSNSILNLCPHLSIDVDKTPYESQPRPCHNSYCVRIHKAIALYSIGASALKTFNYGAISTVFPMREAYSLIRRLVYYKVKLLQLDISHLKILSLPHWLHLLPLLRELMNIVSPHLLKLVMNVAAEEFVKVVCDYELPSITCIGMDMQLYTYDIWNIAMRVLVHLAKSGAHVKELKLLYTPKDIGMIPVFCKLFPILEKLHIHFATRHSSNIKLPTEIQMSKMNVKHLEVEGNNFSQKDVERITHFIVGNKNLSTLRFSCSLQRDGVIKAFHLMLEKHVTIRRILKKVWISPSRDLDWKLLKSLALYCTDLKELRIGYKAEEADSLKIVIHNSSSLKHLSIVFWDMEKEGDSRFEQFVELLRKCPRPLENLGVEFMKEVKLNAQLFSELLHSFKDTLQYFSIKKEEVSFSFIIDLLKLILQEYQLFSLREIEINCKSFSSTGDPIADAEYSPEALKEVVKEMEDKFINFDGGNFFQMLN